MAEAIVSVRGLKKIYRVHERETGLGATFRSLVTSRKPDGVYLQADTKVPYGDVVRVLAIIRSAGVHNVGLVAAEEESQ